MFDTHCHLNFKSFKKNLEEVIEKAKNTGVTHILVPGSDIKNSISAVEIAGSFKNVYAAVGVHPHHVFNFTKEVGPAAHQPSNSLASIHPDLRRDVVAHSISGLPSSRHPLIKQEVRTLEELLLTNKKVVAIGEVGLDYYSYEKTKYGDYAISDEFKQLQKELFTAQMRLAIKHNKSLILHNREAVDDFLKIVSNNWDRKLEGRTVFHCCEPDKRLLDFAIRHRLYIGVDGDVTYPPAGGEKQDFVKKIPLNLLVLETDSPLLLPEPLRSEKKYPNKPENIKIIGQFIADLLKIDFEKLAEITHKNSLRLFAL